MPMRTIVPEDSQRQIAEFKKTENWGRKPVDDTAKTIKDLEGKLDHVFRPDELARLAKRSGFIVESGGKHKIVFYGDSFVTTIPHRSSGMDTFQPEMSKDIIQELIKSLQGK